MCYGPSRYGVDVIAEVVVADATTVILLGSAFIAALSYWNAVRFRIDTNRPWVILDVDRATSPAQIDLSIRNAGPTIARNVEFEFDPELESYYDKLSDGPPICEWSIFKDGIASLPPNREHRVLLENSAELGPDRKHETPLEYKVELKYQGPAGRTYEDTQHLDLTTLRGIKYHAPHTFRVEEALRGMQSALESIDKELGGWGRTIDGVREYMRKHRP